MRLWRVSDFVDLSGQGGLLGAARWHSRGRRIVYLADHPASALLEVLVHLEVDAAELPDVFQLLAVDMPDDVAFELVPSEELSGNWQRDFPLTRAMGDHWLTERKTALLRVPSAIVPAAFNWLLDPAHANAGQAMIAEIIRAPFDSRLLHVG